MLTAVAGGTSAASYYFAKPLTPAQFVRSLERGCVSVRTRLEQIIAQKPASQSEAAALLHSITTVLGNYMTHLRGLNPPPSVAADWRHALSISKKRIAPSIPRINSSGSGSGDAPSAP